MRSAFLKLANGATAFVDGISTGHTCNTSGDTVYVTRSGRRIYWHTYREWASYTSVMRERCIYDYQNAILDPVVGEAVTCSVCKSVVYDKWTDRMAELVDAL